MKAATEQTPRRGRRAPVVPAVKTERAPRGVRFEVAVQPEDVHADDCAPGPDEVPLALALEVHRAAGLDGLGAEAVATCVALRDAEVPDDLMEALLERAPRFADAIGRAIGIADESEAARG